MIYKQQLKACLVHDTHGYIEYATFIDMADVTGFYEVVAYKEDDDKDRTGVEVPDGFYIILMHYKDFDKLHDTFKAKIESQYVEANIKDTVPARS